MSFCSGNSVVTGDRLLDLVPRREGDEDETFSPQPPHSPVAVSWLSLHWLSFTNRNINYPILKYPVIYSVVLPSC